MSDLYGISTVIKESISQTPVAIGSELVFIGITSKTSHAFEALKITSENEYKTKYELTELSDDLSLDNAARYAFGLGLDHVWCINVATEDDSEDSDVTVNQISDAIVTAESMYTNLGIIPSMIVVPNTNMRTNSTQMLTAVTGACKQLNQLFKCQVAYDNKVTASDLTEVKRASTQTVLGYEIKSTTSKESSSGNAIACLGYMTLDDVHIPMSIVVACNRALQDSKNVNELPYRTVGNLPINAMKDYTVHNGTAFVKVIMSKSSCDALAAAGYVVALNKGINKWYTWGDHTAEVHGDGMVDDELYRFDSNVAMTYHIANRFILKWQNVIDSPMTLALRNDIINEEQSYLNYLVAVGALIGSPRCEFRPIDNPLDNLQRGQFVFTNIATVTIPAKYVQLNLVHTNEGINSYVV